MIYNKKLLKGTLWSIIEVLIKRIWDLVLKMILARLLFPSDFGIIGMCTVFISVIQVINDGGMGVALIQKKGNLSTKDCNTAFWTGTIWAFFLFLIIVFIISPFAASFYGEPLIKKILPVLSISILTSSLNTIHNVQLLRNLEFKKIAFINNVSAFAGGFTAIYLAINGYGVWALVSNSVISAIVTVPLYFRQTKWLPNFIWSKTSFYSIAVFGIFVTGSQLLITIAANFDYLIIGKLINSSILGAYTLAYTFTCLVRNQITSVINRVMYPYYSSIQDDINKIKKVYLSLINYYFLTTSLIMLNLVLFGEEIIYFVFGDKWDLTIIPMKFLAVAMMVDVLTSGYNLLFRSIGKPKYEFYLVMVFTFLYYIPSVIIGVYLNGIIGVSIGILISKILSFLTIQLILYKYFNLTVIELFRYIKKTTIIIIIALFIYLLIAYLFDNTLLTLVSFNIVFVSFLFIQFKTLFTMIKNKNV